MRKLLIATLAGSLLIPTVVLAQGGALAPGKPAGVQKAQMDTTGIIVGLGAVAFAVTVGVEEPAEPFEIRQEAGHVFGGEGRGDAGEVGGQGANGFGMEGGVSRSPVGV